MKYERSLFPLYVYGNREQNADSRRNYPSETTPNRSQSAYMARTTIDTLREKMPVITTSPAVLPTATVATKRFERWWARIPLLTKLRFANRVSQGGRPPL